jgi:hypothetical protein
VESSYSSTMAPNIRDEETEKLAEEVAKMMGKTETGAVREALRERQCKLEKTGRRSKRPSDMHKWLETEIWPHIPEEELDRPPLTKAEVEEILGYGPYGV